MYTNYQYKIALVLYTQGLDYDDRIRKEMLSAMKIFPNVCFKVFAVDHTNREENGVTSYGVPYHIPYLKSRDKYPAASHTLIKAIDFYKTIKDELKEYDALWCADVETFPFVLFTTRKPILWDHHELPERFINKPYMRLLYKFMERKCKVVLHANKPRLEFMNQKGLVSDKSKHFVLRNFPEFNEIDSEYDETYYRFEKWLGNDMCVYLQGLNSSNSRADIESIGAVLSVPMLKAVIVGRINEGKMAMYEQQFGKDVLAKRVFFTGQVKQLKTPQYIKKCIISLIFYKNTNINNWYCEPNRLFQNINNGNPVVVGDNPPMKDIVEQYHVGICAETDGSNQEKITNAIINILNNIEYYRANLEKNNNRWLWGEQEGIIRVIVERFLSPSC